MNLDLKIFRSHVRTKHCEKEAVDIDIFITSRNDDRKIMISIRITIRPLTRIKKWNQFTQLIHMPKKHLWKIQEKIASV